jgi:hypothetical protein
VDGGYIDNEGILSMRDLLNHLVVESSDTSPNDTKSTPSKTLEDFKKAYRLVVIRLSAEPSPLDQMTANYGPPARDEWNQLLSAAMNQRAAAGQTLVRDFRRQIEYSLDGCWVEINALDDDAPLGWTLSNNSRKRLNAWLDGPSSPAWKELHHGDTGENYEALKARAVKVDLAGRLETIVKQLDGGDTPCKKTVIKG